MARVESAADGTFLLIEDHCPVCAAAETCQGLCRAELRIFEHLLGGFATIERGEHLLSGGRRCTYRVIPAGTAQRTA
jgi:predicted ArsR family transcriptional regulator